MSSSVVFDTSRNAGNPVYEGDQAPAGTEYTKTLTTTQNSVASLPTPTVGAVRFKELTTTQASLVNGTTKQAQKTWATTQNSTLTVFTDTTLLTACTPVTQNSTATLQRGVGLVKTTTQSNVLTFTATFISGVGHTTYQVLLEVAQTTTAVLQRGIQTIKSVWQQTIPTIEQAIDLAGIFNYTIPLNTVQSSTVSLALVRIPHAVPFVTGGWLLETKLKTVQKRNAAILRNERERERLAKAAAERLAAEELRRQIAEKRLAEIQQAMKAKEVIDAPFKAAYEAQIQQLARENALLRAELDSLKQ